MKDSIFISNNSSYSNGQDPKWRDLRLTRWIVQYLRHAPISLVIREMNRLLALELIHMDDLKHPRTPVLDVGCGDGFFCTLYRNDLQEVYGVDISAKEICQAEKRIKAALTDVSMEVPFQPILFHEIIGNCSLEHIRNIDKAIINLRRCSATDARLIMFVPAPDWAFQGIIQRFLLRFSPRLAMMVSGAFNGVFQHWHLYRIPVWQSILETNGWELTQVYGLGSSRSEFLYRLFTPFSIPGFIFKTMFGIYPNRILQWIPELFLLPILKILKWALQNPVVSSDDPKVYEFVIVAEPK